MNQKAANRAAEPEVCATGSAAKMELLVRHLVRHQEDLFRYIYSLLPHEADARDVLQETCVALYRKLGDYNAEKPFLAWAHGFAYLEVMKHRERSGRSSRHLRDELVEILARERQQQEPELHTRLKALDACLEDLPPKDRDIVRERYSAGCPIDELAQRLCISRRTLFRELDRIRRRLFECINRRLQAAT